MKFHGEITDSHKLKFSEDTRALMNCALESYKPGQAVTVEIKKAVSHRTPNQLNAWWGLIMHAMRQAAQEQGWDSMGVPLCDDQLKAILYHFCGGVGEDGRRVTLSRQNIDEAREFFERCRNWLANFGVIVADPDPMYGGQGHG